MYNELASLTDWTGSEAFFLNLPEYNKRTLLCVLRRTLNVHIQSLLHVIFGINLRRMAFLTQEFDETEHDRPLRLGFVGAGLYKIYLKVSLGHP